MNKMLVAKVMAALNNNYPVMENIDGLVPATEQIVRVMPSNFCYAYEKLINQDGAGILDLSAIKTLVSRHMNLIIDNAFIEGRLKAHGYEEEEATVCLPGEFIPVEDGNGAITVDMVKDLASDAVVSSAYDAMLNRIGGEYCFETEFTHDCLYEYALNVEKNGLNAVALIDMVNREDQFSMLYDILENLSRKLVALKVYKSKITKAEEYLAEAVYSSIREQYKEEAKKLRIS